MATALPPRPEDRTTTADGRLRGGCGGTADHRPSRPRQPPTAALYEHAIRGAEGVIAADGPLVVRTGHAHRSLAQGQVHRRRAVEPATRSGGARSTSRSARRTTTACGRGSSTYVADRDLFARTCYIGAHPDAPALACASTPRRPGPASSRATCSAARPRRTSRRLRAELHDHRRAHRSRPTPRPRAPAPGRRSCVHLERMEIIIVGHRVRRRDQEVARSRS